MLIKDRTGLFNERKMDKKKKKKTYCLHKKKQTNKQTLGRIQLRVCVFALNI